MFKELYIIFILANGDLLREEVVNGSCEDYWHKNVHMIQVKNPQRNESLVRHQYKNINVVGYMCTDREAL